MSSVGRVISRAPAGRPRRSMAAWALDTRNRVRDRIAMSASAAWNIVCVSALVLVGMVAHAWNLFGYPRYQGDEGVYMASAWSLVHGSITPYTYNYGHPPLGWALIALWCELTGGFFTFGNAVNTGRVFMVIIYAVSAAFVFLIAQRLTGRWQTAALATAIFSFSPLSIDFQRMVLLDNIATMWMLVAVFLLVVSKSRMRYLLASAVVFAIAALSKETMVILFPALAVGVWRSVTPFQRRYILLVFGYVALGLVSGFVLVAALKNELFPTGTLLGGNSPHVSMIATLQAQVSRGGDQGSFITQWRTWTSDDALMIIGGLVSMLFNLALYRKRPMAQVTALVPMIYFLFLARGGVTFAYYIIVVLPFFALSIALLVDLIITTRIQPALTDQSHVTHARGSVVITIATLFALLMIGAYQLPLNRANLTENSVAPEIAAMQWIGANIPRSSVVVASHYFYLDMRSTGGMSVLSGAPFRNAQMYWNVATDNAVRNGELHNNWNNIDYIVEDSDMAVDAKNFDMTIINDAIAHSTVVAEFQNPLFWVTIYRVQHTGASGADDSSRADLITRVAGSSAAANGSIAQTVQSPGGGSNNVSSSPSQQLRVIASLLNLRSGPSMSASIITVLPYGTLVKVITTDHGWVYVDAPSHKGWVARQWTTPVP